MADPVRLLEVCSGLGGFSLGLRLAGVPMLWLPIILWGLTLHALDKGLGRFR